MSSAAASSSSSPVRVVEQATGLPKVLAEIIVQYAQQSVYVMGGHMDGGIVATVDRFDAFTGVWSDFAPMQTARREFGAVCLDGLVYAVGGYGSGNQRVLSVERYDPTANAWIYVAPMHKARSHHAVCVLNGHIYAVGGFGVGGALDSVERCELLTDSWSRVAPMKTGRFWHAVCVLDGCIFVSGGREASGRSLSTVGKYDPQTKCWWVFADLLLVGKDFFMCFIYGLL
jgi:N-acetylneuraminic acid mutarotase